jgi:hypothetical protein
MRLAVRLAFLIIVLVAGTSSRASADGPAPPPASIGVARMAPDGTITLRLRASDHGMIGDGRLIYRPGDPCYARVLRHLGGLRPGEVKPVPPWP